MNEPLQAQTSNEVQYYLMVTPCDRCHKGPWEAEPFEPASAADQIVTVHALCRNCETAKDFSFRCHHAITEPDAGLGPADEIINPTDAPSRLIDLGQWLSLFYLMVESAAAETSRSQARLAGYRAALCLAEALKFYSDNELPPPSAFFSPKTAEIFHQHPQNFARQKLRDMQAKLPTIDSMARRLQRDEQAPRSPWWRFWQR